MYKIYDHGRDSKLVYELEVPHEPGDVQEDFSIKKTGSYIISVKVWPCQQIFPCKSN